MKISPEYQELLIEALCLLHLGWKTPDEQEVYFQKLKFVQEFGRSYYNKEKAAYLRKKANELDPPSNPIGGPNGCLL